MVTLSYGDSEKTSAFLYKLFVCYILKSNLHMHHQVVWSSEVFEQ